MNKYISRLLIIFIAFALVLPCSDFSFAAEGPKGWGTEFMNLDDEILRHSPATGHTSGKVIVAVIDSGIDSSHEIFNGKTISPLSKDFTSSANGIADEDTFGHGTSVAGIIAESTPDNVELMILKTYSDGQSIDIDTVGQAIRYAVDNGADVINLSMATLPVSGQGGIDAQSEAIIRNLENQLKYAEDNGVIIIAASGNGYSDIDKTYVYPAKSIHTITVGAVDKNGSKPDFSNFGQSLDFCAPGINISVAAFNTGNQYYVHINNDFLCAGTSFAAPYISACCAFIKMDDRSADNTKAREILRSKCIDYGSQGWDPYFGWGMPHYSDYVDEQAAAAEREAAARAAAEAKAKATTSVTISSGIVNPEVISAAISAAGGRNEYVTELVLGKGVKKISKSAFAGTNISTLIVQSKKLKKNSVKGSLKGSAVKTIKVQIGTKKVNKKYVTKYKKIFTKKNAGKKAKVKR